MMNDPRSCKAGCRVEFARRHSLSRLSALVLPIRNDDQCNLPAVPDRSSGVGCPSGVRRAILCGRNNRPPARSPPSFAQRVNRVDARRPSSRDDARGDADDGEDDRHDCQRCRIPL